MKKLFMLLAIAGCIACNTEDDGNDNQTALFSGTLTVSSRQNPAAMPFEKPSVRFELTEDNSSTYKLTMHEITFAATMPMALNIVIPELSLTGGNGTYTLRSTADPIVPYIGGKAYTEFKIPEFSGTLEDNKLTVTFVCQNDNIPVGDEKLDHRATYNGTLVK